MHPSNHASVSRMHAHTRASCVVPSTVQLHENSPLSAVSVRNNFSRRANDRARASMLSNRLTYIAYAPTFDLQTSLTDDRSVRAPTRHRMRRLHGWPGIARLRANATRVRRERTRRDASGSGKTEGAIAGRRLTAAIIGRTACLARAEWVNPAEFVIP